MSDTSPKHTKDVSEQSDSPRQASDVRPDETDHPTGSAQAAENEATESPA